MSDTNAVKDVDFNALKAEVIEAIKAGKSLAGSGGVLTPLIKQIIEASL